MNRNAWPTALFVLFACSSLVFAPASAAANGTVSGVVVDATNGGLISGATVELLGSSAAFKTHSAKDGSFSFTGLVAGTYIVRASAKEYLTASSSQLGLGDGQSLSVEITLQPVTTTNISTIGRVTVTGHATLNTAPSSNFTVTSTQMLNQGALQVNYGLEAQNGLTMERYDNGAPGAVTTFTIRGAGGFGGGADGSSNTGYEILVLQDGEPVRNGQYGDFDTSSLTPEIYSRVEVVKGLSGASLFGANTIGGTINLVTREPSKTEGGAAVLGFGGFFTSAYNLLETNTIGRLGYLIDLHQYQTNGYVPFPYLAIYQPSGATAPGCCIAHPTQSMSLKSFLGKLRYDFSNSTYLEIGSSLESDTRDQLGLIGNPNYTSTGAPIIDPATGLPVFYGFPGDYVWNIQPKYTADFHTALGGGTLILRSYSQLLERVVDGYNEPVDLPCCFETRSVDRLTGDLASWTKDFGQHNITLAWGANSDNFYFGQNPTNPNPPFQGLNVPFSQLMPTAQGIELYRQYMARDDYQASSKLDLTLALIYSNYNTVLVKRLDPRFTAVFKPDSDSVVKFSFGTGFAPPQLSALFSPLNLNSLQNLNGPTCSFCVATSGNPNLKAETAVGSDLSYQRTFGPVGQVSLDLYHTNVANHIFYGLFPAPPGLTFTGPFPGPVTYISMPVNLSGTVYQGLEFSGTARIATDFSATINYNIQSAYPTGVDALTMAQLGDVVNNQQYLGVPIHKYGWTLNYENSAHATVFFGANYYAKGNAYNQPPFWTYNAGTTFPFGENILHIAWTNIFNANAAIWPLFNFGVPQLGGPGYTQGCNSNLPGVYCTTGYNAPPHMLMVTFEHRWGSLR
jgi:outer membrane receptor protein involved in Fe transport